MRRVLYAVLLLLGCGEGAAARGASSALAEAPLLALTAASPGPVVNSAALPAPASANATLDPSLGRAPTVSATMAAGASPLERPEALRHFFEQLAAVDAGEAHDDVVVTQLGDSHTAADYETAVVRKALQARFGEGGRGFVAIGNPWKFYVQDGLRNGSTSEWVAERARPGHKPESDALFGLGGALLRTSKPGARAWGDYSARASRIEVSYLAQPRGGSFDVYVDGAKQGRVKTRAASTGSGYTAFDVADGPHRLDVVTVGDGEVRLFGALLGRSRVGVSLDALGINGARVVNALAWDEAHWGAQLRHRAPDLVVLAYGTNESGDDTPADVYEHQVVELLGRIARAAPQASCMLVGPPDRATFRDGHWSTLPKLLDVIASQRRVAQAAGCAFFDQMEAMGGPGAMAAWADEEHPRAGRDRVHMTREGYAQLGGGVASALIAAYGTFRDEVGLPPPQSKPPTQRRGPHPEDGPRPIARNR